MKTTSNILTHHRFNIIMLLIMMLLGSSLRSLADEKVIYSTDFQDDWSSVKSSNMETAVKKETQDGQSFEFYFLNTRVDINKTEDKKFTNDCITPGYTRSEKTTDAYIKTSSLKSVTKVTFIRASTTGAGKGGYGLKVKGDGDADWKILYEEKVKKPAGEKIEVFNIDRTNVQLWFYPLDNTAYSFMTSLEIKGEVEAAEKVNVSYFDTDGSLIGEETVNGKSLLQYKYGAANVTLGNGEVFRGWFDGSSEIAHKVEEGTELIYDISLYAKASPKEEPTFGSTYEYNMANDYWYQEDHELIDINGGAHDDTKHGWLFNEDGTITLHVAKRAQIDLQLCTKSGNGTITVTDSNGNEVGSTSTKPETDGTVQSINYEGGVPTTLTLTIPKGTYIHGLTLYNFKPVYVSFRFPNDKIEGEVPSQLMGNQNGEVTLPTNVLFGRKGWTFQGWTDGTNVYEGGKTQAFEESVTLTAKMQENTKDITDTNTPAEVTWPFDYRKAPALNMKSKSGKIYTKTTTVDGETQDVSMTLDATSGKIDNTDDRINELGNGAEGAQVNDGTAFHIPAVYGMKVIVHASDKVDDVNQNTTAHFGSDANDCEITLSGDEEYTVPDEDKVISDNGKTLTLVYKGNATTLKITFKKAGTTKGWGFYKDITAVYPVLPNVVGENVIEGSDATLFPNEKAENAGTVRVESATTYPNTGKRFKIGDTATITAIPGYGYQVTGYRVKGTGTLLTTKEVTDETFGTLLAADYTVTDGITTVEAVYTHLSTLHKVTVKTSNTEYGTVSVSPKYENFYKETYDAGNDGSKGKLSTIECWYTEGTEVVASAETAEGRIIDYWSEEGSDESKSDAKSYTFTVGTTDISIIAHMKLGYVGTVIFDISNAHVNGESVKDEYMGAVSMPISTISNVRSFTIPTNYTFWKNIDDKGADTDNSYTLQYWIDKADNDNRYELGTTYSFKKEGTITLTPVFAYNPTTRTNRINNPVVRYDFGRKVQEYYDLTSKETRKVCAQEVNIGNNENTYWATHAYFEVLTDGVVSSHIRDVSMWINTGKSGYLRNDDFDDWCAFGPGTTLWCTASVGTTVSILSYSKITSTTIDGAVPTLNEKRTAEERAKLGTDHAYVYSYTTNNAATHLPIIIGDDYSYYQWIEVSMLAANMVNLHATLDNEDHATITDVTTASTFGVTELEDGGYAFRQGDRVQMSIERKFGYELDGIIDPNKTDSKGDPLYVLKMRDDGKVDMVDFNDASTVHPVEKNEDGSWGTATGDNKTVFVLTPIELTPKKAEEGRRTVYDLEFAITTHRQLQIVFKEKPTYYITYNAGKFASGIPPVAQWVEAGDPFVIPRNQTLYYEGNTLDYWTDGDYSDDMTDEEKEQHIYRAGTKHTAPSQDLRMLPVFTPNSFNLLDIEKESTAVWHFTTDDGAPTINYEGSAGILVTQLTSGDKHIDLKIDLDARDKAGHRGKFNNTSSGNRIQINPYSIIRFPASLNCVVGLTADGGDPSEVIVDGKDKKDSQNYSYSTKAIKVVCTSDSAYLNTDFKACSNAVYGRDFSVTYQPQVKENKAEIETLTCDGTTYDATEIAQQMKQDGYVTFTVSPWLDAKEAIPAVTGTATNGGTVTATTATVLTKEATATVHAASGTITETYPIRFSFNEPEDYPEFVRIVVNNVSYTSTSIEVYDVPRSGIIKVMFNRTMAATSIDDAGQKITSTSDAGKELVFKYWDMESGATIPFIVTPEQGILKDIYGKTCQQTLTVTLHIKAEQDRYQHQKFDFVVGEDGTMEEAITAANNNTKGSGERYFVFVPDGEYYLAGNETRDIWLEDKTHIGEVLNGMTVISKPNVSLIGQSKNGATIWNKPAHEGISYTATIHIGKQAKDFYAQDITLENRYDYLGTTGRAAAFWDQGSRTVMKRTALKSWQDTYYSNNSSADYRGYYENSDIYGVVDFLCGDGNIWLEKCNIIIRERNGNNICAPAQGDIQEWGYVFNNCTVKPELKNPVLVQDGSWTLARPWNGSPACTFINTKMVTQPTQTGWQKMSTGLKLRLHEYRSTDANGNLISLGARSLASSSPAPGSDDCVLSAADAEKYTLRNAMGGTDAFEPDALCQQIDAASSAEEDRDENHVIWQDNLVVDDGMLEWDTDERALCYFVFKRDESGKWIYKTNSAEPGVNLNNYGSGYYCIRAANQRGGLGAATKAVLYTLTDPYELEIKQLGDLTVGGKPYGWSTICLPFNARVPEGVTVYAATAYQDTTATEKIDNYTMSLTEVTIIDSLKGYVVYGPAGKYYFNATSRSCQHPTILTGNATAEPISTLNRNGYVLANKMWGLGFYKFTGSTYAPYRAWLPREMVDDLIQQALSTSTRGIRFNVMDPTSLFRPHFSDDKSEDAIYDLSGQRVREAKRQGIYIMRNRKVSVREER